jgi:PelA/Pel-15E family pectate lyase
MVGIMNLLQDIVQGKLYFSFIDEELKKKVNEAYQKGIDCILKCQIKEKGRLTVWCQQHDNVTLKPTGARTFELASKCSEESSEIVEFLMHIDKPNKDVINAVESAIAWFKEVAIKNTRIKTVPAETVVYQFHTSSNDRVVVEDPTAPLIWTRYYELGTDKPMFANRDGKVVYQLSDVLRERRTGYAWYGYWPAKIIEMKYPPAE